MATRFEVWKATVADLARVAAELDQVRAQLKDIQLRELLAFDEGEPLRGRLNGNIDDLTFACDGLLKELRTAECDECSHAIAIHGDRYGCEYERGDVEMPCRDGGTVMAAAGPCHCKWGLQEAKP